MRGGCRLGSLAGWRSTSLITSLPRCQSCGSTRPPSGSVRSSAAMWSSTRRGRGSCGSHVESCRRMPCRTATFTAHSSRGRRLQRPRSMPFNWATAHRSWTRGAGFQSTPRRALRSTSPLMPRPSPAPRSCPVTRCSMPTRSSTSRRSTSGAKRTNSSSRMPVIRSRRSTPGAAHAGSWSSSPGSPSPTRRDRRCCSRPTCPLVTTCPARTSGWNCSTRQRRSPRVRTRGSPRTGPRPSTPRWSTTWHGASRNRTTTRQRSKDMLSFFNERVDISVDGERFQRPRTPWS